jgi:hypothetical protein
LLVEIIRFLKNIQILFNGQNPELKMILDISKAFQGGAKCDWGVQIST